MLEIDMSSVILDTASYVGPMAFEIFMVVYVQHEIATVIFVDFYEQFCYILL